MDWANRTEGRGNAGETSDSFFHPSRPSRLDYLIQRKSVISLEKLTRGAGRTPFHLGNPGSIGLVYAPSSPQATIDPDPSPLGGNNLVVEADETYIGGKARNKAFGPPPKKESVLTVVQPDGEARFKHIANVTATALRERIVTKVDRKSYLMRDEALV